MKHLKKIKLRLLLVHLTVSFIYPVAKAAISDYNRLLIFTDSLTIVALLLLIGGIVYSFYLRGDFDISGYLMKRGMQRGPLQSFQNYLAGREEKREESFNYPLFLGIAYLVAALILSYGFL